MVQNHTIKNDDVVRLQNLNDAICWWAEYDVDARGGKELHLLVLLELSSFILYFVLLSF